MKRMTAITLAVVIFAAVLMNGCGGTNVQQAPQTTLGQELLDLEKAYTSGIISESEYKRLRKDILNRYDD
jgi:hypothetical protein